MHQRLRLLERLNTLSPALTLISAPPGFGKTHLVRNWMSGKTHHWLTVKRSTTADDFYSSLTRIVTGQPMCTDATRKAGDIHKQGEDCVKALTEALSRHTSRTTLVLDGIDHALNRDECGMLIDLLHRHQVHAVVISRRQMPETSRLVLYEQASALHATDLAFSFSELRELLQHLPPIAISNAWRVTRGWPAICSFVTRLSQQEAIELGRRSCPPLIQDFIREEILSHLSPPSSSALHLLARHSPLHTSTLLHLIGADASEPILIELVSSGAVLEDASATLQIHPIVRLCVDLTDARTDVAVHRLCAHLQDQNHWSAAVSVSIESKSGELAFETMSSALRPLLDAGQLAPLRRWQGATVHDPLLRPLSILISAELEYRKARFSAAETLALRASELLGDLDLRRHALTLAGAAAHLCHRDSDSARHYRSAMATEPSGKSKSELLWGYLIATSALESPESHAARRLLEDALDSEAPDSELRLAAADFIYGRSIGTFREALARADRANVFVDQCMDPMLKSVFLHALSYMHATNGNYGASLKAAAQALAHATRHRLDFVSGHILPTQALCHNGLGRYEKSVRLLNQAVERARDDRSRAFIMCNVSIMHARMNLMRQDYATAAKLSDPAGHDVPERALQAELHAVHALSLDLSGSHSEAAFHADLARSLSHSIEAHTILAVYAAAQHVRDFSATAIHGLRAVCNDIAGRSSSDSLVLAYRAVPNLLQVASTDYAVRSLLAGVALRAQDTGVAQQLGAAGRAVTSAGNLYSLTKRESEIASMIAEGMSNAEISERLVLSPGTVKVHLRSIHKKLGTKTRAQAVLKLLRE